MLRNKSALGALFGTSISSPPLPRWGVYSLKGGSGGPLSGANRKHFAHTRVLLSLTHTGHRGHPSLKLYSSREEAVQRQRDTSGDDGPCSPGPDDDVIEG